MAESLEYKTALSCFDKLVTALKLDPRAVSNELVAEGLIPPVEGSLDAQKLAQLLLDKIKLSPKRYYDVIKVFCRHEWLGDIVDILQEEHSIHESEGVDARVQIPGGKQACTEGMSKLSIHSKESPKLIHGSLHTASDDSLKLELDCPHRQSFLPIPNPVVRFEELSADDRKDLFAQMHELTKEIYIKFKTLLNQVYKSLKECVEHTEVVVTLTGDDAMIFDDDDKLDEAKDMFEVFKAIRPHLSYFNHDLLKLLVKVHGTLEEKKCLDEYLKSFANYCRAMPCAEEICGSDDSRPNRIKIKFKLNFDRQRLRADYVRDNIINNIASILKIKPSSLYLRSIKEGCVSLEFLVPSFLYHRIFPLIDDQIVFLYVEVKVTSIHCDQRNLYVDVETLAKPLIQLKKFKYRLETDIGYATGNRSQVTSAYSSERDPLTQPPKKYHHIPAEYLIPSDRSKSVSNHLLHQLHNVEDRRDSSVARYPKPLYVGLTGSGSTTSSRASSGYFGSVSSMGSGYHVMDSPERFDYDSFSKKLVEVWWSDPLWYQLGEEWEHHLLEWHRLKEDNIERDNESEKDTELKLKTREKELANSKWYLAFCQRQQRESELERDLLSQELLTATNDNIKIEIQRQMEEAEGSILELKEKVNELKHKVNQYEEYLAQFRIESHTPGSKLSSGDARYGTPMLKTALASSSPAPGHFTCPSCGGQCVGDRGLYSGKERCVFCSGSDRKQQTN